MHEVEHGVFTPLVLSTTGGMGREATVFYKRRLEDGIPGRSKNNTQLSWDGSFVVYHLQSFTPPSYVFMEADLLTTVQSMN